ncbi:hypothetical protein D3C81_1396150 [compost metagenome]
MDNNFILYRVVNGVRFVLDRYSTQEAADLDRVACLEACKDAVEKGEIDFVVVEGDDA